MIGKCRLVSEYEASVDRIQFTHTSAVTAWTPIWSDKFGVLIPMVSADANVEATYYRAGQFKFKIVSAGTVAKGDIVYYTVATDDVTTTAATSVSGTTCFPLGRAVEAGSATAGYVTIELFKIYCNITIYKAVTAANQDSRIWITSSATSGTLRALSLRTFYTGAGTADGEALRAYTVVTSAITASSIHGAHITAQLGDETTGTTGSCSGAMAGVRATLGTGPTMTISAGTFAAVRADTYLQSTLASANCSYIYACDVGTYGVTEILRFGTIVSRTTSKTTITAAYAYVSGGMTIGAATGALRVVTADGAFYIPLVPAANLT